MSLRIRLVILIVLVVFVVSFSLSALYLDRLVNTLSNAAIERSELASQQINAFVLDRLNRHSPAVQPQPPDSESAKAQWTTVVASDPDITDMLERTMALSPALLEVNIADAGRKILASSNPARIGSDLSIARTFAEWRGLPFYRRLVDLTWRSRDYQVSLPLGIEGQAEPLFTIQVVASTVFLRPAVLAEMQRLAEVSALALIPCLLITITLTNWTVLRPLLRIEAIIDRISQGTFRSSETHEPQGPREFAALESKLNMLGQQYSGATQIVKQRPSVEEKLERFATRTGRRFAPGRDQPDYGRRGARNQESSECDRSAAGSAEGARLFWRSRRGIDSGDRYSVARSASSGSCRENLSGFFTARESALRGNRSRRTGGRSGAADEAACGAQRRNLHVRRHGGLRAHARRRRHAEAGDPQPGDERARSDERRRASADRDRKG